LLRHRQTFIPWQRPPQRQVQSDLPFRHSGGHSRGAGFEASQRTVISRTRTTVPQAAQEAKRPRFPFGAGAGFVAGSVDMHRGQSIQAV
jgi:hypothetical protein